MRLETPNVGATDRRAVHVRLDQIGGTSGLWWVAREFEDHSTRPEGMFVSQADAKALATTLATSLGVAISVTRFD